MPKKGISGQKRKNRTFVGVMVVTCYIKLFHTRVVRHNGILIPLLLVVAETISNIKKYLTEANNKLKKNQQSSNFLVSYLYNAKLFERFRSSCSVRPFWFHKRIPTEKLNKTYRTEKVILEVKGVIRINKQEISL